MSDDMNKVLDFWFGRKGSADYLKRKSFWYGSSEGDDQLVAKHLGEYYSMAKEGSLDSWLERGGEGALALIILLDQTPRNIFRNKPEAYMTDAKALSIAKTAVQRGWDQSMSPILRRYMYSPFNHSENLEDQKMSVKLFTQLGDSQHLYWAHKYHDLIQEFGRFPHRDHILGRNQ